MKKLTFLTDSVMMGCDPEFFFTNGRGTTRGSEKILPKTGLDCGKNYGSYTLDKGSSIIIDGVQAELNPQPNTCRAYLGNEIHVCFRKLNNALKKRKENVKVAFSPVVKLTKKELGSLSEQSKIFGCAPSTNVYKHATSKITVNPKKYLKRSAGGHIHLGFNKGSYNKGGVKLVRKALSNLDIMVPILDIIVGNTCVLIDRSSVNVERRKVYGKVGEYRTKPYGLEYRTLSNFWLHSYQLMSFVMGMSRMAVMIVAESTPSNNIARKIMESVNKQDIIDAIQNNDFALAYSNWLKIEDIILEITTDVDDYSFPINPTNIQHFHWFIKKGMYYWFNHDSFKHWVNLPEGHDKGWESFLDHRVYRDMNSTRNAKTSKEVSDRISYVKNSTKNSLRELNKKLSLLKALEPSVAK